MMQNLSDELRRKGISQNTVAKLLGCTDRTVRNKLDGNTEFTVREALTIRDELFPGRSISELFGTPNMEGCDHNDPHG